MGGKVTERGKSSNGWNEKKDNLKRCYLDKIEVLRKEKGLSVSNDSFTFNQVQTQFGRTGIEALKRAKDFNHVWVTSLQDSFKEAPPEIPARPRDCFFAIF